MCPLLSYDILSKNNGPKISMGIKVSHDGAGGNLETPGPGNYNYHTSGMNNSGSGVTMGAKYDMGSGKKTEGEPGPGAYNLGDSRKCGVKIGTAKRTGLDCTDKNPGPAQYTYDKRPYSAGPKHAFGKATRKRNLFEGNAPGPGQYELNSYIKTGDNLGRTMGERFKKTADSADLGPGPGYYDSNANMKRYSSGVKIGKAKRGGIDNVTSPGPGAYDAVLKVSQGTKIGTSLREGMGRPRTPGPGDYDPMRESKVGITIGGHRGRTKVEDIPGPGKYSPENYGKGRPCSAK
jgi:hypothetical protein